MMIEEIVEQVYEHAKGIGPGQFVWAPVPHLEEVPRVLEVERARSEEHFATKFRVVQMDKSHFSAKTKLPIAALALGNTEELLISKAKKRLCIVVCCNNTIYDDAAIKSETKGRRHLQDRSMILAPLYGSATPDDDRGFPPKMVARIRVFLYNQFFYLPKGCTKSKIQFGKEGIVRLDRIFAASPNRGVEIVDKRLAPEALALLMSMVRERFGAPQEVELKTVRELLFDSLPADCKPQGHA